MLAGFMGRLRPAGFVPFMLLTAAMLFLALPASAPAADEAAEADAPVSFYRQVRPILQRHCAGCHQPAKPGGKLLLTSYADFLTGGENGPGFVAGEPDESLVLDYVIGDEPLMPLKADPLAPQQIELVRRWIAAGARDDTPPSAEDTITQANPPVYHNPPVITALDYSPDSQLLAISGFHEILLHRADGSEPVARLVGRAQRIESLRFSPDGTLLGAVGGTPALFGEIQFWDVAEKKLRHSATFAHDTLFGASFNDTGTQFAFGGADNRARVVRVEDGEQVMRFDAHSDWVFGTTFSLDVQDRPGVDVPNPDDQRERLVGKFAAGEHLITVSRDMSMKLTYVENGQFIDNITSITPGALTGGLIAVQRHPQHDQVLTGGSDGEPKLYKIFRTQARQIGDDFNRIRTYPKMPGRIFALRFNSDGSRFVAGSSTGIGGAARIYNTDDGKLLHELQGIDSPVFAVAFRPDGQQVAVAGFDGQVRLYDTETGELLKEFIPVTLEPPTTAAR